MTAIIHSLLATSDRLAINGDDIAAKSHETQGTLWERLARPRRISRKHDLKEARRPRR